MHDYQKMVLVKSVYDINLNYLGVRSQESGGKKEEERESFLVA
ncbi:hypothetical protein [Okeania sp. SIO1I7]|nr:hypothetical protein [Okeania sp. SIO1I7]